MLLFWFSSYQNVDLVTWFVRFEPDLLLPSVTKRSAHSTVNFWRHRGQHIMREDGERNRDVKQMLTTLYCTHELEPLDTTVINVQWMGLCFFKSVIRLDCYFDSLDHWGDAVLMLPQCEKQNIQMVSWTEALAAALNHQMDLYPIRMKVHCQFSILTVLCLMFPSCTCFPPFEFLVPFDFKSDESIWHNPCVHLYIISIWAFTAESTSHLIIREFLCVFVSLVCCFLTMPASHCSRLRPSYLTCEQHKPESSITCRSTMWVNSFWLISNWSVCLLVECHVFPSGLKSD